jgi:hypothetical protein
MFRSSFAYSAITLAAYASSAFAATTVTRFTGVIDQISANEAQMLGTLNVGDLISGHFTFNDDPAASFGFDRFAAEVGVSLPTYNFNIASNYNYIRARNNRSGGQFGVFDEFHHAYDSAGPAISSGPFIVHAITIRFVDEHATMFDGSDTFPITININDIETATWSIQGQSAANPNQRFSVSGTVTAIVPEPQALVLAALVAPALLSKHRRRRSSLGAV